MANDSTIIFGFVMLFVLIGFITPIIALEFDEDATSPNVDSLTTDVSEDTSVSSVTAFQYIGSIFTMFFWNFFGFPVWLNVVFTPFRIALGFIVARNIWVGGGG